METEDKDGRSVILLASARAAWKAVFVLIRMGADVNHRDNCSRNLLHHIVISGGNLDQFTQELKKVCHMFDDGSENSITCHFDNLEFQFRQILRNPWKV